jgi:RNA polymerase sigma factor (sigma-70 family)
VDVYESRYRPLVHIARLTTGSTALAEEIVQDAFADLYRRFGQLDNPEGYVQRAVMSRCTSWVRRRILERRHVDRLSAEPRVELAPESVPVLDVVGRLPLRQRTAVILRYYADWSEQDIAAALRCRPGTVKSLLSRARSTLAKELSDDR